MKKSNKTTLFYVLTSIALFVVLAGGGVYGLYLSIGMNYVGSTGYAGEASNSNLRTMNVAYQNNVSSSVNGSSVGMIILSAFLIVISICDFVSMIKQISFFKQYKFVRNSSLLTSVESKNGSKKSTIVFAFIIDIVSTVAGGVGLFLTIRYYSGNGFSWLFYLINGLVSVLSIISIILLVIKIKQKRKCSEQLKSEGDYFENLDKKELVLNINKLEYDLLKLKHLKICKILQSEEYETLRKKIIEFYSGKNSNKNYD